MKSIRTVTSYVTATLFSFLGEHQQPRFPGLTRGLVAVLLYWDGKRCIANSLRTLIQSRRGKTWTLELRSVFSKEIGKTLDVSSVFILNLDIQSLIFAIEGKIASILYSMHIILRSYIVYYVLF